MANEIESGGRTIFHDRCGRGIEVIIGTYENLLLGYGVDSRLDGVRTVYFLEASFTDDSHRGALRCLSVSPNGVLASSSTDDSIRLHDLRKRKEIGGLFEHSGTVNSITFFRANHMFSASEDGTICMWKCKNWEMLRTLKGHKSQVMSFAVHPSGKLGLSVGNDRSFLTWDLVTGKLAFQRKIRQAAHQIHFTSSGDHYVLVYPRQIEVCSLQDTKTVQKISVDWRINTTCLVEDNVLAVGGDDRHIVLFDTLTGHSLVTLDMAKPEDDSFDSRVKCISVLVIREYKIIAAATAKGDVKVFRLSPREEEGTVLLFYETRTRITCMTLHDPASEMSETESDEVGMKEAKQAEKATKAKSSGRKTKISTKSKSIDEAKSSNADEELQEEPGERKTKGKKAKKRKISQETSPASGGKIGKRSVNTGAESDTQPGKKRRKLTSIQIKKQLPQRQTRKQSIGKKQKDTSSHLPAGKQVKKQKKKKTARISKQMK